MRFRQYKFKTYLNATHHITIGGKPGEKHPHTWEICLDVLKTREEFVRFSELEEMVERFISVYQDKDLNETPPFHMINPTLENCSDFFFEKFQQILSSHGWIVLMMTVSETPTRSYVISNVHDSNPEETTRALDAVADEVLEKIMEAKVE